MEKENNVQNDVNKENSKEITLGKFKYLHSSDEEYDYLVRKTDDGIKMTLQFTKDEEESKVAMEGIKRFFSWL